MVEDKGPRSDEPKDKGPNDNLKNPLIDRVCPICRTFGKNVKFMDLKDEAIDIYITIVTCLACRAVYSMDNKV